MSALLSLQINNESQSFFFASLRCAVKTSERNVIVLDTVY